MRVLIRRSRRKTMSLCLDKDGNALVRAPYGVSENEIYSFVDKHERWLNNRLAEHMAASEISYRNGDILTLFGKRYVIACGRLRIDEGVIYLPAENRSESLIRLLKKLTLREMTVITEKISAAYGFTYNGIRVSSARGRWGSCNKKSTIAYSFRVAFLAPELCEYIAAHELCHTRHFNHSALFWREVEQIRPDWRACRKQLKMCRAVMNLL